MILIEYIGELSEAILSNNTTFKPPLFSLVNTFKELSGQNALRSHFTVTFCRIYESLLLRQLASTIKKEQFRTK
jgi:hypothetical protein